MSMKKNRTITSYNDGVVDFYREPDERTTFGARVNPTLDEMNLVGHLFFADASIREQDFVAAEQRGFNVTRKIKTYFRPNIDTSCRAVIGDMIYGISYIDSTKTEMYLYLEGGERLG